MRLTPPRCWGCNRILAASNTSGLCESCEAAGVRSPTGSQPIGLVSAPDSPDSRGQRVVVTGIDIPLSFWIDVAFKVTVAFLIAAVVLGIPIGIVVALILSAT